MAKFNRTYQIWVGDPDDLGVLVKPPMHVEFWVHKTSDPNPNKGHLRIINLAEGTRKDFFAMDNTVKIYAGYVEDQGAISMAMGQITRSTVERQGADLMTKIHFEDGLTAIRDTAVTLSYGHGAKSEGIIRDLAQQMHLSLRMSKDVHHRTWAHGFSFYGAAYEALTKVCRGAGLEWSIQSGTLQIVDTRGTTVKSAPVLNADSGLIGSPEQLAEGATEQVRVKDQKTGDNVDVTSTAQAVNGWKVKSLLLPDIEPGDRVKLESQAVDGWFRVDEVRHQGEYGSGDWISELTLVST